MDKECYKNKKFTETGFNYTLSMINGRYKLTILYALYIFNTMRYNELKKYVGVVSHKTLSLTLKELEKDNLIIRKEYPQIPPKVEYSLSSKGSSFIPILSDMCYWGEEQQKQIA
ncbi:MAG: helix-turn-helix transcriptional regulator [Alphaproteobacteria bacterium]|nr:helix-turn-helix transcriptional regulator [Alphaproteobacteria bacterium]